METYRTRVEVAADGTAVLRDLPFAAGETVAVIVVPESAGAPRPVERGEAMSILEQMIGTVEGPEDWAAEHDHYLYGTPRRGEPST